MAEEEDVVVAEFKKNQREVVRAVIRNWNGRLLLDLRVCYQKDEQWLPTPKGLCLSATKIADLKAAVAALETRLTSQEE